MLNNLSSRCLQISSQSSLLPAIPSNGTNISPTCSIIGFNFPSSINAKLRKLEGRLLRVSCTHCRARRRVRYEEDDDEEDGDNEYGYNEEIGMLEMYSQGASEEVLLVKAIVDGQEAEVLIFKGFSSSLSYETSPDPTRSILPARAIIKSIDRIKGPFDPSNIHYIEKDLAWESFKTRLQPI